MKRLVCLVAFWCCLASVGYAEQPVYTRTVTIAAQAPALTFSAFPTAERDAEWPDMILYRLDIAAADGRALPSLSFASLEGAGQQSHLLNFIDLNFDGYLDIEALRAAGASNMVNTYFLYDPAADAFAYEPALDSLSSYQLYPGQRLILNYQHDSAATGVWSLFVVNGGKPVLFRQASMLYDERDDFQSIRELVTEYGADGGETVLLDDTHAPFDSEGAYDGWYDVVMEQLWKGADAGETPLVQYLYLNPQGGRYYHTQSECQSISPEFWPQMVCFDRGQLFETPYNALSPCPVCCGSEGGR